MSEIKMILQEACLTNKLCQTKMNGQLKNENLQEKNLQTYGV